MSWWARLLTRSGPERDANADAPARSGSVTESEPKRVDDSGPESAEVSGPEHARVSAPDRGGESTPERDGGPGPDRSTRSARTELVEPTTDSAVPLGVRVAAAWSWRALVIAAAATLVGYVLVTLSVVVIPALIAVLITALTIPVVDVLARVGVPRSLAAGIGLVGLLALVGGLLTLVGQQIVSGFADLAQQVLEGVEQIRIWLVRGPLQLSNSQLEDFIDQAVEQGQELLQTGGGQITAGVLGVASTVTHVVAGFFLVLFATYFFLYEGGRIWAWLARLFPRTSRARVDGAAQRAWATLTSFVRATVLVAFVDAVGIALVALLLDLPLWFPIGVLVFLGAFIPIVGAVVSGAVAVLVALVTQGPISAVLMMLGVLAVQQLESHILQPLLLGRLVRVHPLAVILAVGAGVYLAGIAGALFAVPIVAVLNSVLNYLLHDRDDEIDDAASSPSAASSGAGASSGTE